MILIIDASITKDSRTSKIGMYLASKFKGEIMCLHLEDFGLKPLNGESLEIRNNHILNDDFSSHYFDFAKYFKKAEFIIVIAPFYDYSFPASLKCFIEQISINGLTFTYQNNRPVGLCNARKAYYVVTSGGPITNIDYSFGYISSLFKEMYGIKEVELVRAENLDIEGANVDKILKDTYKYIDKLNIEQKIKIDRFYISNQDFEFKTSLIFPYVPTRPFDIFNLLISCYNNDTCAPRLRNKWSINNPTVGQCSITAFLIKDIFGGEVYGINLEDGSIHCYNKIENTIIDFTSEQFGSICLDYNSGIIQDKNKHFSDNEKHNRYILLKQRIINRS